MTNDSRDIYLESQRDHDAQRRSAARFHLLLLLFAFALAALAVPRCLPAQVVHVGNYSGATFSGWKRCTVDVDLPAESGRLPDGTRYVGGRRIGVDVRVVDLHVTLQPGELRTLDLPKGTPAPFARGPLPVDPLAFFGAPSIAGTPLQVLTVQGDGAAWLAHLRARSGRLLCTDLWVWWYPDRPGWACGEVVVTASNPGVPDVVAAIPEDLVLRFGAADVLIPGGNWVPSSTGGAQAGGACLLPGGTTLGDGQARSFPLVLVWRQHLNATTEWASAGAAANMAICANGIGTLWPGGNPRLPAGASPLAWTVKHWAGAIEALHRWEPEPGVGPNPRSGDTGAQADQVFVGAECQTGPAGLGAEVVRYLVALSQSRRPCHHLESDGAQLRLDQHPDLRLWDGRAHWHRGVSPDQLGKSRSLTDLETSGWWGPDVEHWLIGNLSVAARLTGSPALQWQLAAQARVYLLQWTVDPHLSTSSTYAARAVGWEGIGVTLLWRTLEDRQLADAVRERWVERLDAILLPQLSADIWDVRKDDPRLGTGDWWMPWQQSVGAYGLDLAGRTFGRDDARALALRSARRVLDDAWRQVGERWSPLPVMAVDGRGDLDDGWLLFGMPMSPAVVLLHEPRSERARAIWAQLMIDSRGGGQWVAPEVGR